MTEKMSAGSGYNESIDIHSLVIQCKLNQIQENEKIFTKYINL